MATVRFSEELRNRIIGNAKVLFDSNKKEEVVHRTGWGQRIYDGMYRDTIVQMKALPCEYMDETKDVDIRGVKFKDASNLIELRLCLDIVPAPQPRDIADDSHGLKGPWTNYSGGYLDGDDLRWATLVPELKAHAGAIAKQDMEKTKFVEGVRKIINTYSTLAPALKAWPPLWDLLPSDKQERHRHISEKRSKSDTPVIEGVDFNSLTGITVAAKLTGGNS